MKVKRSVKKLETTRKIILELAILATMIAVPAFFYTWFIWQWNGHYHPEQEFGLRLLFLATFLVPIALWITHRILGDLIYERTHGKGKKPGPNLGNRRNIL